MIFCGKYSTDKLFPIRNLSSWQRWELLEIDDYGRSCLEKPMKQENLELVILNYPRNFLYWKLNYKQRWSSLAFPSVPNMFVKVVGIPAICDDSQLLADYHWHSMHTRRFCPLCNWLLFEFWKQRERRPRTHTHTHAHTRKHACTHTHAGDNLQYKISTEWNILKCAHDFIKCMLCLAFATIILELKSMNFFGMNGHKE